MSACVCVRKGRVTLNGGSLVSVHVVEQGGKHFVTDGEAERLDTARGLQGTLTHISSSLSRSMPYHTIVTLQYSTSNLLTLITKCR